MGRPPIGKQPMTAAERQRRHREKFRDSQPVTKSAKAEDAKEVTKLKARIAELEMELQALRQQRPRASSDVSLHVERAKPKRTLLEMARAAAPELAKQLRQAKARIAELERAPIASEPVEVQKLLDQLAKAKAREVEDRRKIKQLVEDHKTELKKARQQSSVPTKAEERTLDKVFHPDSGTHATKQQLTEAFQVWSALCARWRREK